MKKSNLCAYSLIHSLAVLVYVFLVAGVMLNAEQWFGQQGSIFGVVAFLLLFVLSATIVGSLVLGKPVLMYLDGEKKEGVKMFLNTVGWILLWMVVVFVVMAVV